MTTTAQLRQRLAAIAPADRAAPTDRERRLITFAEELIGRLEQQPAPGYDDRPDWPRGTELGAADRDPNTRD